MPKKQLVLFWRIHAMHSIYINCFISSSLTRILTPSWSYLININNEGRSEYTPPLLHPPVVLLKVTRIFGPLLLVDGRALRELATHFYWSTCGENRQPASICRQADHWGASGDLISSKQGLYYAKFWSLASLTGWWAHQRISLFQFPTHFASKTVQWLNFNEKYENKNYSRINACGLAIFF